MAKKKKNLTPEEEKQIKLQKLKKVYDIINEELSLDVHDSIEQVHMLVDAGDKVLNEICIISDDIKLNDLCKAQELTPLDKKTYLDFVRICSLKNNDSLKDKAISKFEEDFSQKLFITNLRHSFLESFMSGYDLKITNEDNEEYKPFSDYKSDEFNAIMQDSAKKQEYINLVLRRKFKQLSKAAEYITQCELTPKDFKNLVDWQHYKDGCYPTPTSPSKIWSVFDKFNYAHRTLNKWGYNDVSNNLKHEFGLDVNEIESHPVDHPWQQEKKEKD